MARILTPRPVPAEEQAEIEHENGLIGWMTGTAQTEMARVLSEPTLDAEKLAGLLRTFVDKGLPREDIKALSAGQLCDILSNARTEVLRDGADAMSELAVEDPEFSETWDTFWAGLPEITTDMCAAALAQV